MENEMSQFSVSCTNPSKGSIESCTFDSSEWPVIDAVEEFCREYSLEQSEVRVEPLNDDGEVITEEIVAGVEVERIFG
jgi:hypothetical protein